MRTRPRARWIALITTIAALGVLVPTVASGQSTEESTVADYGGGELRLHMVEGDSLPNSFIYESPSSTSSPSQLLNETRCEVTSDESLVDLDSNSRSVGLFDEGLGVKSGGAQGVACSRISDTEVLTLSLVKGEGDDLEGLAIAEAHLDIEVKQGAKVILSTYVGAPIADNLLETFELRSGDSIDDTDAAFNGSDGLVVSTSAMPIANCRNRADSGNDAGANDNCRWVIEQVIPFDTFTLSAGAGEFTLEGGDDGTPAADDAPTEYGSDTIFFLGDFLDCDESISAGDGVQEPKADITRLDFGPCDPKEYTLDVSIDGETNVVNFAPEGDGVPDSRYTATLASKPYDSENPVNQFIKYDPDGEGFRHMQWCLIDPGDDWAEDDPNLPSYVPSADVLPETIVTTDQAGTLEAWCIISSTTVLAEDGSGDPVLVDGVQLVRTIWTVIGEDDPGFRFG